MMAKAFMRQSATFSTMNTDVVTLVQIRDIMAYLPNLDDLSLSGYLVPSPPLSRSAACSTIAIILTAAGNVRRLNYVPLGSAAM